MSSSPSYQSSASEDSRVSSPRSWEVSPVAQELLQYTTAPTNEHAETLCPEEADSPASLERALEAVRASFVELAGERLLLLDGVGEPRPTFLALLATRRAVSAWRRRLRAMEACEAERFAPGGELVAIESTGRTAASLYSRPPTQPRRASQIVSPPPSTEPAGSPDGATSAQGGDVQDLRAREEDGTDRWDDDADKDWVLGASRFGRALGHRKVTWRYRTEKVGTGGVFFGVLEASSAPASDAAARQAGVENVCLLAGSFGWWSGSDSVVVNGSFKFGYGEYPGSGAWTVGQESAITLDFERGVLSLTTEGGTKFSLHSGMFSDPRRTFVLQAGHCTDRTDVPPEERKLGCVRFLSCHVLTV